MNDYLVFKQNFEILSKASKDLVRALKVKKSYDGFMNLLTELYPDNAHFIYELLQNAEDTQAEHVFFRLYSDRLEFDHDGKRSFTYEDVESITSIGNSTKKDDPTSIGKFGVGFKAVFACTNSPIIQSGKIKFKITELVVPELCEELKTEDLITHFVFPFGNTKKSTQAVYDEILKGLISLDHTSILFLKNISNIIIELANKPEKIIEKNVINEKHIKIEINNGVEEKITDWLLFTDEITINDEGKNKDCLVSVAYNYNPESKEITPIDNSKVCIYFPCEKETSNLKFHINAPFASTVARDSIRDCEANNKLLSTIANLVAASLTWIRDNNMLNVEFISVLPNSRDYLYDFYKPILLKIIEKFKSENLVPMREGGHARAKNIFIDGPKVNSLFDDHNLVELLNRTLPNTYTSPVWVAQWFRGNTRIQSFYNDLGIENWTIKDMILVLKNNDCSNFFEKQSNKWHKKFYALLLEEKSIEFEKPRHHYSLSNTVYADSLKIIKVKGGGYEKASNCYFYLEAFEGEDDFVFADNELYSFDNVEEKGEADNARKFLEKAGVKTIGDKELIEKILAKNYSDGNLEPNIKDIIRFNKYYERTGDPEIFKNYFVFKIPESNLWTKGKSLYIDTPFLTTRLSSFYGLLNNKYYCLSNEYLNIGIGIEKLVKFSKAVGAKKELEIVSLTCYKNPDWQMLYQNGKRTSKGINSDYTIESLEEVLSLMKNIDCSELIWEKMNSLSIEHLTASYSPNGSTTTKYSNSTLVHLLKNNEWVPQKENDKIVFVKPIDASVEFLPKEFLYNKEKDWLKSVEFGFNYRKKIEKEKFTEQQIEEVKKLKQNLIDELGFKNETEAKELLQLNKKMKESGRSKEEIEKFLKPKENKLKDLSNNNINNADRRKEKVENRIKTAPEKDKEERTRSVDANKNLIDSKPYLRNFYTIENELICQLCHEAMPFKKRDKAYYFEAVEVLSNKFLQKEDEAQYLALCPECSARYTELVKKDDQGLVEMKNSILSDGNKPIALNLDNKHFELQFHPKHRFDLQIVLKSYGMG